MVFRSIEEGNAFLLARAVTKWENLDLNPACTSADRPEILHNNFRHRRLLGDGGGARALHLDLLPLDPHIHFVDQTTTPLRSCSLFPLC